VISTVSLQVVQHCDPRASGIYIKAVYITKWIKLLSFPAKQADLTVVFSLFCRKDLSSTQDKKHWNGYGITRGPENNQPTGKE